MITINLDKAKTIAHGMRRAARAREFEPLDAVIAKQIPGTEVQQVEAARQLIRDKYVVIQNAIDVAGSVDAIKIALNVGT